MSITLQSADRIGFLGDCHGDLGHILNVCRVMRERGVGVIVQLGDFGVIFPGGNWRRDLDRLSNRLSRMDMVLYFVDGNHEAFDSLYSFPVSADGIRWVRPRVGHLPRGYRTALKSGRTLAALGGAASIDFPRRLVGVTWWHEEAITEHDLEALGTEPADVLISHEAPEHVPALVRLMAETAVYWSADGLRYAAASRAMFHRGFVQVRPKLVLCGHYHLHVDEIVSYKSDAREFTTRVIVLNRDGAPLAQSAAILDAATLDVTPLTSRPGSGDRDGRSE